MTTTLTLRYSADLGRAEYFTGAGWLPLTPPPNAPRDAKGWPIHSAPMDQPMCPDGGLHLRRATRYRAPSRLLSHLPPFQTLPIRLAPSPLALERGLDAPDYADDGYLYLAAASASAHVAEGTVLLIATHIILPADGAWGAAAALRRAGLLALGERVVEAYQHSAYDAITALRDILDALPALLSSRPPTPPDQLDPARDLAPTLTAALAVVRGEALP